MIDIQIHRLQSTGIHCTNKECKRNPNYMINILGSVWYIKVDTPVAIVMMGGTAEYYCRDCIDWLYQYLKTKLDSKLWAFH